MYVIDPLVMRPPILQLTFQTFLYYIVGPLYLQISISLLSWVIPG
jgi:hypothetical protein